MFALLTETTRLFQDALPSSVQVAACPGRDGRARRVISASRAWCVHQLMDEELGRPAAPARLRSHCAPGAGACAARWPDADASRTRRAFAEGDDGLLPPLPRLHRAHIGRRLQPALVDASPAGRGRVPGAASERAAAQGWCECPWWRQLSLVRCGSLATRSRSAQPRRRGCTAAAEGAGPSLPGPGRACGPAVRPLRPRSFPLSLCVLPSTDTPRHPALGGAPVCTRDLRVGRALSLALAISQSLSLTPSCDIKDKCY